MQSIKEGTARESETISLINKNFRIIWKHNKSDKKTQAIKAGRYHLLVGDKYADKHFAIVKDSKEQKIAFKIRHSYYIEFQSR